MEENVPIGYLQVKTSLGSDSFPVEGTVVLISREDESGGDNGVLYSLRTNKSGLTDTVALEAKAKSLSETPGNVAPYTTYSVLVDAPNYYPVNISGVSIFEGISATLPVPLIPIDYGSPNTNHGGTAPTEVTP